MAPGSHRPRKQLIIGWRENVALPELSIGRIKAKIDTGARTTALHAEDVEEFWRYGHPWVRFLTPPYHARDCEPVSARIVDRRAIKNTSGVPQTRIVIHTTLVLGNRHWGIDVSLTDRKEMGFDLILGRTAVRRHGLLVDPGRSFLVGPPRGGLISSLNLSTEDPSTRDRTA
ncbi:MAG: ATP-dependent zinc protease [Guyparkeria sp.]|uniref:ATP-dependent zinc protease family protein n=1 Tax=Guyparkeria sp. TaxID=2035736 RepID=UPI00397E6F01